MPSAQMDCRLLAICALNGVLAIVAGASFRSLPVVANGIEQMVTSCDGGTLNVTVTTEQPFKGTFFAKEFSQECSVLGAMHNVVVLSLPTSGCGVRLSVDGQRMRYSVTLVLQQDRYLRQIADLERVASCDVAASAFTVRSTSMETALATQRRARMRDPLEAMAWMEIVPVAEHGRALHVGDEVMLVVTATLPVGIGWRVVDCVAHDGLGDASQRLLAEDGCPLDAGLLPILHQDAPHRVVARFAAFKFPDRDRLHLACGLQLCRTQCQMVDCTTASREGRRLDESAVLDRLEVFNSVEVAAPGLEWDSVARPAHPLRVAFGSIGGERAFCVSPDTMALTFCALGVVFVCAVVVAAGALLKARRSPPAHQCARSFFSTTSSGGSAGGSRLLLDSPPPPGYGRIL